MSNEKRPPVEFRFATAIGDIEFSERVISVIAVPYEDPATVEYRNEIWQEVFERNAFDGIESKQNRIPVNREHDRKAYVGQVQSFDSSNPAGLLAELKIFKTPAGDETLQIAADGGLSSSIGFAVRGSDQVLDRRTMTRRIKRAFVVDHISLVAQPAYENAKVLAMRDDVTVDDRPKLLTPSLDEVLADQSWLQPWTRKSS